MLILVDLFPLSLYNLKYSVLFQVATILFFFFGKEGGGVKKFIPSIIFQIRIMKILRL